MIARYTWLAAIIAWLAGAATSLAYAPYQQHWLAAVALVIPLWLSQHKSLKQTASIWFGYGFGKFAVGISWVHVSMAEYGGMPLIASIALMALLAGYLALYPMLAGVLHRKLNPHAHLGVLLLTFPALWTIAEWLRGFILTGFPWLWEGYALTDTVMAPMATYAGALGLTYLVVLLGCSAYVLFKRNAIGFIGPIVATTLLVLTPTINKPISSDGQVDVALVQGNIAQSVKWQPETLWPTLQAYMDLSRPHYDADIIIWPEAAIPAPEFQVVDFIDYVAKAASVNQTQIVSGTIHLEDGDQFYNSLRVLTEEQDGELGANQRYNKHHLLPIGEFVPFGDLLRPLAPFFNLPMSSFSRGTYQQPNLSASNYNLLPAICYEIAFPELVRANLNADTDMLLTVSNDAWFGSSAGPLQHMQIAQMRAIELGRPLLRATNNGVTAVVDANGIIQAKLPQFEAAVLRSQVPLQSRDTLFARYGQWPTLFISALLLALGMSLSRHLTCSSTPEDD
ncbi:apolipoprotein N-acyltransferase [Paraferrimonas haliotis]|uniref:Apolipoprotein N-acyltransferase n=1 Tax=Paraferrimonas haliotis TaxID=2013866 RepID=A0AA37TVD4_9GAMM|nr:apolipoprotein N-acyltransferase [Paraferrimonas haliotis]GLS83574.1 apolipoprotein N-acyltransferase [Paraferrimonas haliotis]